LEEEKRITRLPEMGACLLPSNMTDFTSVLFRSDLNHIHAYSPVENPVEKLWKGLWKTVKKPVE